MAETPTAAQAQVQAEQEFEAALSALCSDMKRTFVREYLVDLQQAKAAIRAGYSPRTARQQAYDMMREPLVARAVQAGMEARALRLGISADRVVQELWAIGTADPADLIEYRRTCCRHCWGKEFRRQHTPAEQLARLEAWRRTCEAAERSPAAAEASQPEFDPEGGDGYDATLDPNPDCPECRGQGEGRAFVKDTRDLSPEARRLYAGVKVGQNGVEVKMQDRVSALVHVGRHLGMFTDNVNANVSTRLVVTKRRFTPLPEGDDGD